MGEYKYGFDDFEVDVVVGCAGILFNFVRCHFNDLKFGFQDGNLK